MWGKRWSIKVAALRSGRRAPMRDGVAAPNDTDNNRPDVRFILGKLAGFSTTRADSESPEMSQVVAEHTPHQPTRVLARGPMSCNVRCDVRCRRGAANRPLRHVPDQTCHRIRSRFLYLDIKRHLFRWITQCGVRAVEALILASARFFNPSSACLSGCHCDTSRL